MLDGFPWNPAAMLAVVAVLWFGYRTVDRELIRLRDRVHELANRMQMLTGAVDALTRQVELLSSGG